MREERREKVNINVFVKTTENITSFSQFQSVNLYPPIFLPQTHVQETEMSFYSPSPSQRLTNWAQSTQCRSDCITWTAVQNYFKHLSCTQSLLCEHWVHGLNHPTFRKVASLQLMSTYSALQAVACSPTQVFGAELNCLLSPYSTERSWQDLDLSQNATLGLFFATTLSRKRLAFIGMLSRRVLQFMCLRRLLASLESRRRRSCRTMPWKASQTLCCMAAEVSINLQSNTAAQARPSETESKRISTCI